jgi:hypothetical protein
MTRDRGVIFGGKIKRYFSVRSTSLTAFARPASPRRAHFDLPRTKTLTMMLATTAHARPAAHRAVLAPAARQKGALRGTIAMRAPRCAVGSFAPLGDGRRRAGAVERVRGTSGRGDVRVAASSSSSGDDVVVIPGDYRIGGVLIGVAVLTGPLLHLWTQFLIHGVLGGFLAFQASRVRFRFTRTDLEVVFIEPGADDSAALNIGVDSSGDNKLQGGGENRWAYDSITNWEFWWPGFPCLVYFKETQTKSDGQPHFFPIIMDGKKLYEVMLERMPESVNAKPSPSEWSLDLALEQTSIGRQIKENLNDEQLKQVKDMTGFPGLDK